jgi:DNA-binding transcriptional LysR family regulator
MPKFEGLSLVWVEAFVEVAKSTKRTAAAAQLGITQGTITKHLHDLERWLGKLLVVDGSVPARLTTHGEEFLPVALQILALLEEARRPAALIETTPTPPRPPVSAKHIKVPALRPPQEDG